ncbi:hypothetical protein AgCh_009420 [Apium graveolens]
MINKATRQMINKATRQMIIMYPTDDQFKHLLTVTTQSHASSACKRNVASYSTGFLRTKKHCHFHAIMKIFKDAGIEHQCQEESIANAIRSWSVPGGSLQLARETLAGNSPSLLEVDDENLDLGEHNINQCKRKIIGGHYTAAVRVLSSFGFDPYNAATLEDLKVKHPFRPPPSLPHTPTDHQHLVASPAVVLDGIKSFPRGTSYGRDGLHAQHFRDCLSGVVVAIYDKLVASITQVVNLFFTGTFPQVLGEYITSAPLTPLVKPGGGIHPIVVGTV